MNIFDALISLPSLLILAPLMIRRRWVNMGFLVAAAPLALYLLYTLISLIWANSPDFSKTFRAAGQVAAIFIFFSYLQCSGNTVLLRRALLLACICTAILGAWHLIVMYGILDMPWSATLYQGVDPRSLGSYGVQPTNAMLATLLIAPQAAMLLGLVLGEGNKVFRYLGLLALAILVVFLIALERRTGQVSIIVAIITCIVLYRNRLWCAIFGATLLCAILVFIFVPEFILSRGLSWRPAIWMATLESIGNAPIFGHGITNRVTPVLVFGQDGSGIGEFRHPHNMALSVTYFLGIAGLVLWALLWIPGAFARILIQPKDQREGYMLIPLLVGVTALMFDGGDPLSPFHFDWFCFWFPAMLILSSQAVNGYHQFDGGTELRLRHIFPPIHYKQA